jgi:ZIP family zinc transporter
MIQWLQTLSPVQQALLATGFTWFVTALGAGLVFFFKTINRKVMDGMFGSAAITMVDDRGGIVWLPPLIGFLSGGAFL